jgi:hypothetical protein
VTARGTTLWWLAGLALALLVTLPAWLPWLDPRLDFRAMDDARNHLMRLYHLDWLVRRGVWYPRWLPDLFLGYGYPVFNYYAPGFYYLTLALRTLLRLDLWDAFRAAGVVATVLGATGSYALIVGLWRRVAPAVLGAALVLYAPYAFQTNLFKRADLPEILALSLLPFLLLAVWRSWTAPTGGAAWRWAGLATAFGAAVLLLHNLAALLAAAVAAVWVLYLLLAVPGGAGHGVSGRLAALGRIAAAGVLAAGLTAFFWLPAATEGSAVQLEWLHDGDLRYDNWLLDPAGDTPRQQSVYNRQTRAGPIDLHLRYPHQLVASPKLSLAQGAVTVVALLGLAVGLWRRPAAAAGAAPAAPLSAVLPFWLVALTCWGMTFTLSAPLWAAVPGLSLLQFPWRLLGPLAVCLAVAVGGSLVPLLRRLEAGDSLAGRRAGWLLLGLLTLGVALNGASDRAIPFDDLDAAARAVDGTNVVLDERRDPKTVGTTSGREFLPRQVDVPLFSRGAFRYRDVMERLYPEADWLGGRLLALSGDVRFLGWRAEPLRLTALVANDGAAPARIGIRQLDFPGWRAWLDGTPWPVERAPYVPEQQVSPGFIVLSVPPGEHAIAVAFGPSPRRVAGMAISLVAVAGVAAGTALAVRRRPGAAGVAAGVAAGAGLLLAVYLVWRGLSPAFAPFALLPAAEPAAGADGVWRAPDLDGRGNDRNGLVVNVVEAVRRDRATLSSPAGSERGPSRFIDVRQLTVSDEDDPERGASGTSRREWLYLHPPSEVSVDVALPAGRQTWLQAALTLDPAVWQSATGDGVRFVVAVAPLDERGHPGDRATVLDRDLNPRARTEERQWMPVEVDLSAWAGQAVRLTLRTEPREELTNDWAGWANPVVAVREQARAQPAARDEIR